jgi:RNA polymerase sigma-70 factor (ECF subfamily)
LDAKAQENISQQQLDQTLMLAYAKGDAAAFDLLYAKHKMAVYRFFIRQNLTTALAEELCHDTWLKLINNRLSYQANALFTPYLFTIARRIAIDHKQKKIVLFEKQHIENNLDNLDNLDTFNKRDSTTAQQITELNNSAQFNTRMNQTLAVAIKQQIAALPFDQREVFIL